AWSVPTAEPSEVTAGTAVVNDTATLDVAVSCAVANGASASALAPYAQAPASSETVKAGVSTGIQIAAVDVSAPPPPPPQPGRRGRAGPRSCERHAGAGRKQAFASQRGTDGDGAGWWHGGGCHGGASTARARDGHACHAASALRRGTHRALHVICFLRISRCQ